MFSTPQYSTSELQQYNYFVMQEPVFEEKIEEPVFMHVYEENRVLYCASSTSEGVYYYTYVLNNPLIYTDPSGYLTQAEYDGIIRELWNSKYGGTWNANGSTLLFASTKQSLDHYSSSGGSGWGGGGSWQPVYSYSIDPTGTLGGFKKSGLIGGPKYRWQPGNFRLNFSSEITGWRWVSSSDSPLYTPIAPTPWLHQPVDYISSPGIEMTGSGSGGASSNGTSVLHTVEASYKAANLTVTGAAFAMKYSRINTNIHYKVGSLTSFWKYYAPMKNTSAAMNASFVPYAFATWHLYDDIKEYQSGNINQAELGFNTLTNYYGAYLFAGSGAAGFGLGFVYGAWVWGTKEIYMNFVKPTFEGIYWHMYNLTHPF